MHFLPDIHLLHWLLWFPLLSVWSNSGGNKSTSNNETSTTSGQNAPSATGGSQAIGSGSIGVAGTGAKYLETGASDTSGNTINASSGGTIQIGDPQATNTIAALAQNFADTVQTLGTGGGGSTVVTGTPGSTALGAFSWTSLGVVALVLAGLALLFRRRNT